MKSSAKASSLVPNYIIKKNMQKKLVSVVIVTRNRIKEVLKAVGSIYKQTYRPKEVIVVVNGSLDNSSKIIKKLYPKTKIIKSQTNIGAAGGRNLGLLQAKGEFILFMDDDAFAHSRMVSELFKVIAQDNAIGIVQPKIYDLDKKNILQGIGHGINLLTGRVFGIGVGERDCGQYEEIIDIPMVGCTWLVRKNVFRKVGNYDDELFIPYEDSDFSIRTRKAGFRICFAPRAYVWHANHQNSDVPPNLRWLGITTTDRAYRISRNKLIFMKKHAPPLNFLFFLLIFVPLYTILHSATIIMSRRFDLLIQYWQGVFSGFVYILTK